MNMTEEHKNMLLRQIADFVHKNGNDKTCKAPEGECICGGFETALIKVIREEKCSQ